MSQPQRRLVSVIDSTDFGVQGHNIQRELYEGTDLVLVYRLGDAIDALPWRRRSSSPSPRSARDTPKLKAARSIIFGPKPRDRTMFCSRLVARAYTGIRLAPDPIIARRINCERWRRGSRTVRRLIAHCFTPGQACPLTRQWRSFAFQPLKSEYDMMTAKWGRIGFARRDGPIVDGAAMRAGQAAGSNILEFRSQPGCDIGERFLLAAVQKISKHRA